eukprot:355650-Chlamydomonas_euryale.AAC.2
MQAAKPHLCRLGVVVPEEADQSDDVSEELQPRDRFRQQQHAAHDQQRAAHRAQYLERCRPCDLHTREGRSSVHQSRWRCRLRPRARLQRGIHVCTHALLHRGGLEAECDRVLQKTAGMKRLSATAC